MACARHALRGIQYALRTGRASRLDTLPINGLGELTSQSLAPAISPPVSSMDRAGYIQR